MADEVGVRVRISAPLVDIISGKWYLQMGVFPTDKIDDACNLNLVDITDEVHKRFPEMADLKIVVPRKEAA